MLKESITSRLVATIKVNYLHPCLIGWSLFSYSMAATLQLIWHEKLICILFCKLFFSSCTLNLGFADGIHGEGIPCFFLWNLGFKEKNSMAYCIMLLTITFYSNSFFVDYETNKFLKLIVWNIVFSSVYKELCQNKVEMWMNPKVLQWSKRRI